MPLEWSENFSLRALDYSVPGLVLATGILMQVEREVVLELQFYIAPLISDVQSFSFTLILDASNTEQGGALQRFSTVFQPINEVDPLDDTVLIAALCTESKRTAE